MVNKMPQRLVVSSSGHVVKSFGTPVQSVGSPGQESFGVGVPPVLNHPRPLGHQAKAVFCTKRTRPRFPSKKKTLGPKLRNTTNKDFPENPNNGSSSLCHRAGDCESPKKFDFQPTPFAFSAPWSREESDSPPQTVDTWSAFVSNLWPDSWSVSMRVGTRARVCRGVQPRCVTRCLLTIIQVSQSLKA